MIKFIKVRQVKSPERWTETSSWIDFFIPTDLKPEDIRYTPLENIKQKYHNSLKKWVIKIPIWYWVLIPTWIKMILPNWIKEWYTTEIVFYNKSWISTKKWLLVWAQVIDNDYRWEVHIHLINTSAFEIELEYWQKIVQWILRDIRLDNLIEIQESDFDTNTERWSEWFWSTWV